MKLSRKFLKKCILIFIVLASLAIIFLPGYFLGIPPLSQLIKIIERYYAIYGYWIVFFGALGEAILYISWNFPGSLIVILGAVFSGTGTLYFPFLVIVALVGFTIGFTVNYFLGYHGYYRIFQKFGSLSPIENMRRRLEKRGMLALFIFYIQPQLGVFSSTACGIMRIPFRKFLAYTLISQLFWNLFWGGLAYFIGSTLLAYVDSWWFRLLMWIVFLGMLAALLIPQRKLK